MQTLIEVIEAVETYQAQEAKSRIPPELKGQTFFSINNLYHYFGISDDKLCDQCQQYDGETIVGSELRKLFPYLTIDTENIIYPNVHPNCRCLLIRLTPENSPELFRNPNIEDFT